MDERQVQALQDAIQRVNQRRVKVSLLIMQLNEEKLELAEVEERLKLLQKGEISPVQVKDNRQEVKRLIEEALSWNSSDRIHDRVYHRQLERIAFELHINLGPEEE